MEQHRHVGRHLAVFLRILSRKAPENIPDRLDPDLPAPFQQLDVLNAGYALLHQCQNLRAEALHPRLNTANVRFLELPDMGFLQIRLHLPEQVGIERGLLQRRDEGLEVGHVQDVIDHADGAAGVSGGQAGKFTERACRRLAPVLHGLAVQPAERAVRLFAPPAAACRLIQHHRLNLVGEIAFGELPEVVVEIAVRKRVHVLEEGDFRRRWSRGAAQMDAGNSGRRQAPLDALDELRKYPVGLARDHRIQAIVGLDELRAHLAFAIRAAHHDHGIRRQPLDLLGNRNRCRVLLEGAGESDDRRAVRHQLFRALPYEQARMFPREQQAVAESLDEGHRIDRTDQRVRILVVDDLAQVFVGIVLELSWQQMREHPIRGQRLIAREAHRNHRVELDADPFGEIEREMGCAGL